MRIAIYLKHFPASGSPLIGGTSIAVDGLASGLSENGADVRVLCEGRERSSFTAQGSYMIECFPGRRRKRGFGLSSELAHYAKQQLAMKHTVCLVNGMFHPGAYSMARMLDRQAIPYIVAPHDPYEPVVFRRNPHLKWPYWYLFERRLLRHARAVQVLDIRHAAFLRRLGISTPVIETPNGVRMREVPPESALEWRCSGEAARLVFLGRIDAYNKGLDLLLKACARVASHTDVRLTVQGPDWGDRAALARGAPARTLADRVTFLDPDYQRPASQIIGEHDVFCLPSRFEGFGLSALEAMVSARVLLVSETAGIVPHLEASGCGVVVRPSVTGIETGLFELLARRSEWRAMGLAGRHYALRHLQWKTIAAAALDRYASLIS